MLRSRTVSTFKEHLNNSRTLTVSEGSCLKPAGLWCGVLPEDAAVGRADRLVWDELVVLGKLSPSPRSSSSRGGQALVIIPAWVSCSSGRDSGRLSSPSRPAFWLFCFSSAVAPLSSWQRQKSRMKTSEIQIEFFRISSKLIVTIKENIHKVGSNTTHNGNLNYFTGVTWALWPYWRKRKRFQENENVISWMLSLGHRRYIDLHGTSHVRCFLKNHIITAMTTTTMKQIRIINTRNPGGKAVQIRITTWSRAGDERLATGCGKVTGICWSIRDRRRPRRYGFSGGGVSFSALGVRNGRALLHLLLARFAPAVLWKQNSCNKITSRKQHQVVAYILSP